MEDYNLWADLLDTFQSSAEWVKALWLAIPPAFVLGLIWLFFRRRVVRVDDLGGELLYTIYKEPNGLIQIYRHGDLIDGKSELVLIEHQLGAPRFHVQGNGERRHGRLQFLGRPVGHLPDIARVDQGAVAAHLAGIRAGRDLAVQTARGASRCH